MDKNKNDVTLDPTTDIGNQSVDPSLNPIADPIPNKSDAGDPPAPVQDINQSIMSQRDPIRYLADVNDKYNSPKNKLIRQMDEFSQQDSQQEPSKPFVPNDHLEKTASLIGIDPTLLQRDPATDIASSVMNVAGKVSNKIGNWEKQAVGGLADAVKNTWNAAVDLSTWAEKNIQNLTGLDMSSFDSSGYKTHAISDLLPEPKTWDESLVRGVSGWVIPFAAWAKAFKVGQLAGPVANTVAAIGANAATGSTALDPHSQGFSDLINKYAPSLMNPYSDYFVSKPGDTDAEGRLKNTIAGLTLGALGDGLFNAIKTQKAISAAKTAAEDIGRPPVEPPTPNAEMQAKVEPIKPTDVGPKFTRMTPEQVAKEHIDNTGSKIEQEYRVFYKHDPGSFEKSTVTSATSAQEAILNVKGIISPHEITGVSSPGIITKESLGEAIAQTRRNGMGVVPEGPINQGPAPENPGTLAEPTPAPGIPESKSAPKNVFDLINDQLSAEQQSKAISGEGVASNQIAGKAGNINLDRLDISNESKALLSRIVEIDSNASKSETRGVIPNDQTLASAKSSDLTPNDVLAAPTGTAYNAEDATAIRGMRNDAQANFEKMATKVQAGDASDTDKALFLQTFQLFRGLQLKTMGMTAEAGRTLQALSMNIGNGSAEAQAKLFQQMIDMSGGNQGVEDIADLYFRAKKLGVQPEEMFRGVGTQVTDNLAKIVVSHMLGGLRTFGKKAFADGSVMIWHPLEMTGAAALRVPQRIAGAVIPRLAPTPGSYVSFGQAGAYIKGSVEALEDAFHLGYLAFNGGPDITASMRATSDFITGFEPPKNTSPTLIDRAGDVLSLWGYGPRILNGITEFSKTIASRAYLRSQAVITGESIGLHGDALGAHIKNFMENTPQEAVQAAGDYAEKATFTSPLQGGYDAISKAVRAVPGLRLVIPFHKVELNVLDYAIQRSPLAALPTLIPGVESQLGSNLAAGGVTRDMAISQLAIGTSAMATLVGMAGKGMLTGSAPKNQKMRKVWEANGLQENSLTINGKNYKFDALGPMGKLMGMAADYGNIYSDIDANSDVDKSGIALAMGGIALKHLMPDFIMRSVGMLIDAANNPEDTNKMESFIKSMAAMPGAGGPSSLAHVLDTTKRDTSASDPNASTADQMWSSIKNKFISNTPWLSDKLPPQMNIFGEPIVLGPGYGWDAMSPIYMTDISKSPGAQELLRLGMTGQVFTPDAQPGKEHLMASMPPRYLKNGQAVVKLDPEQYGKYVQLSAGIGLKGVDKTLKESLDEMAADKFKTRLGPFSENDDMRRTAVGKEIHRYRLAAEGQLKSGIDGVKYGQQLQDAKKNIAEKKYKPSGASVSIQ